MIFDCSKEMMKFLEEKVRLSKEDKSKLKDYREKNLDRLKNGLKKNNNPMYKKAINQGSYAMNTINQDKDNDYDIDVGIIFEKDDLKGSQGADMTALEARKMVCEAMQDDKFKKQPKVLKNCVRVYYEEGHHVDMPIYRQYEDESGDIVQELASSDWEESDPESITSWYNDAVIEQSPDETNGRQMRRVTRLIKKWAKSRGSWNMPSGFMISVLVDEQYINNLDRDDDSLYQTLKAIRDRLYVDKNIDNPVTGDSISDGKEHLLKNMYEKLDDALENTLYILEDDECTYEQAMKAWSKFFNDDFFKDKIENSDDKSNDEYRTITAGVKPWLSH
jgi:hypothetical protein